MKNAISENLAIYYTNRGVAYDEQQNYGESIKAYQAVYKSSCDSIFFATRPGTTIRIILKKNRLAVL